MDLIKNCRLADGERIAWLNGSKIQHQDRPPQRIVALRVLMSNLFWLTEVQMKRLRPFFPKGHAVPRLDDRRVLSGLRWCDAPKEYGPLKALYNRWKRWGDKGIFARMVEGTADKTAEPKTVMFEVSRRTPCVRASLHKDLTAHRTATSLRSKTRGLTTNEAV
jgi:transposase